MSRVLCETWDPSSPSAMQAVANGPPLVCPTPLFSLTEGGRGYPGSLSPPRRNSTIPSVDDQSPATNRLGSAVGLQSIQTVPPTRPRLRSFAPLDRRGRLSLRGSCWIPEIPL